MITTIKTNFQVSVAFLDLALMDNFYMYGYALPVWNLGTSFIVKNRRRRIAVADRQWTRPKVSSSLPRTTSARISA